jgi:hypothetical protein
MKPNNKGMRPPLRVKVEHSPRFEICLVRRAKPGCGGSSSATG